jgi:DNA polymerase-4
LSNAFARGAKPVRLLGVGVRLLDLRSAFQQLELFEESGG